MREVVFVSEEVKLGPNAARFLFNFAASGFKMGERVGEAALAKTADAQTGFVENRVSAGKKAGVAVKSGVGERSCVVIAEDGVRFPIFFEERRDFVP